MDPSTTRTKGSNSPRSALKNHSRKSSVPPVRPHSKSIRPASSLRLAMIGLVGLVFAALLTEPWWTLAVICLGYLALMPLGIANYARVRRQRAAVTVPAQAPGEPVGGPDAS